MVNAWPYGVSGIATHIHVDSAAGSDANSGASPAAAVQTIAKALSLAGASPNVAFWLKCGGYWREMLQYGTPGAPINNVQIASYGTGAAPILDAADIVANANFTKTSGLTNTYQAAVTLPSGSGTILGRAWENGVELQKLTTTGAVDSTPGSYTFATNSSNNGSGGADTLYIHASDSSDVITNGKTYEFTARLYGLSTAGTGCVVIGIETRRNAHQDGSLTAYGTNCVWAGCIARSGSKHNALINPGSIIDGCTFVTNYDPFEFGNLLVCFPSGGAGSNGGLLAMNSTFQQTQALANDQGCSAFFCHTAAGVISGNFTFAGNQIIGTDYIGSGINVPSTSAFTGQFVINGLYVTGDVQQGLILEGPTSSPVIASSYQYINTGATLCEAVQMIAAGCAIVLNNPLFYVQNLQHGIISNAGNSANTGCSVTINGGKIWAGDTTTGDTTCAVIQLLGTGHSLAANSVTMDAQDSSFPGWFVFCSSTLAYSGNNNKWGEPVGGTSEHWWNINGANLQTAGWLSLVSPNDSNSGFTGPYGATAAQTPTYNAPETEPGIATIAGTPGIQSWTRRRAKLVSRGGKLLRRPLIDGDEQTDSRTAFGTWWWPPAAPLASSGAGTIFPPFNLKAA